MEVSRRAQSIKASSTLAISAKAAELKAQGKDMVTFGVGEPDFDTPAHIREAAKKAIDEGKTRYTPAAGTPALRKAVCDKLKKDNGLDYEPAQVVISNGAKHSLMNAFMAILNEGDEVIIPAPFWLSYAEMVKIAGGVPVVVHTKKENNFMLTKEELEGAYTAKTKALILTSPSNPTGMISSLEDLQMVADFAVAHDIFVISDEIYAELTYGGKNHVSIASVEGMKERTVVLNCFAKSFSMTGWRLGYEAGPKELMKVINKVHAYIIMCTPTMSQYGAIEALRDDALCDSDVGAMREAYDERRQYLVKALNDMGLTCFEPRGAFYVFPSIAVTGLTSQEFCERLLHEASVAVVPGDAFGKSGEGHVRISYAYSMDQLQTAMGKIRKFLQKNGWLKA